MRIVWFYLIFTSFLIAQSDVPILKQYVNDLTNSLTMSQISSLERDLKTYDDTTSNQIVVLMINTLEGEDLVDFSISVAEKNKIGRKGKDNGILILVVKNDRKVRIEVGYGLEEVIPDALASNIIRNIMIPYFRKGNYYEGLHRGILTLQDAIAGKYTAENSDRGGKISIIVLIITLLAIFIFLNLVGRFNRGWHYYRGGWYSYPKGRSYWGGFGGFGGFGGLGGGGFGCSGFSGGGGSFGGGGASGSW